jgi:transposase-like protein
MAKQEIPIPETMLEAVRMFADQQVAHDFFVQIRFPNGVACPRPGCGSAAVAYMPKVWRWYCNDCKRQFSAKVGTVLEDSPISLTKWLPAIWLIASNRNGISSYEIARGLKVTQKTAWFMLHRIREMMADEPDDQLSGTIEVDESYIGGKWANKPNRVRKAAKDSLTAAWQSKTPVVGMVERKGRVRAFKVPNVTAKTLLPKLIKSIDQDATVYTDSATLYTHINEFFLKHASVNHTLHEYVRGNVHTNNIECFWSVLKRTIGGTYTHVHPRHLDRYLAEQVYRFNERENTDGPRFAKATKGADGKRLTWKALTAKR